MKVINKNLGNNLYKYILYYLLILNLYVNACEIWKASDCRGQPTAAEGIFNKLIGGLFFCILACFKQI